MSGDLPIFSIAKAMMRHAEARHGVIAENVANADTPGYRAQDMKPFDQTMAEMAARAGAAPETARTEMTAMLSSSLHEIPYAETNPNGNTVTLEDQIIRSAEAQGQHDMALGLYRKAMDLMRLGLGRQ